MWIVLLVQLDCLQLFESEKTLRLHGNWGLPLWGRKSDRTNTIGQKNHRFLTSQTPLGTADCSVICTIKLNKIVQKYIKTHSGFNTRISQLGLDFTSARLEQSAVRILVHREKITIRESHKYFTVSPRLHQFWRRQPIGSSTGWY